MLLRLFPLVATNAISDNRIDMYTSLSLSLSLLFFSPAKQEGNVRNKINVAGAKRSVVN